jgi:hypothetical protein
MGKYWGKSINKIFLYWLLEKKKEKSKYDLNNFYENNLLLTPLSTILKKKIITPIFFGII